jgi:UDP-N-acetyl-D-mannosaminuronic acid dehydrogenase
VAVLGLAFKADTDDERDSLSHKLIRLLERELADVSVHDPVVATPTSGFEEAVSGADVVIVATNHSEYSTPEALRTLAEVAPECLLVDPWNALGTAQVFAYVAEVAALRA